MPAFAQVGGYGYANPYSRGGYYPSGRYYSRDFYYSARPPDKFSDEGAETPRVDRLKALTAEKLRKAPVPPPTKGPLMVVVSIAQQKLTVYDEGVPFLHSKVSTGMAGHLTPTGVFSIIQKSRWHRSNLYSDAPMPFMQRITWSGVALHAGVVPGHPASHGCIRMPEEFAIRMWRTTQMGARVIVVQNDVAPVSISHPVLFAKKNTTIIVPPPAEQAPTLIELRSTVDTGKSETAPLVGGASGGQAAKAEATPIKIADVALLRGPQGSGHVTVANDQPGAAAAPSGAETPSTASIAANADNTAATAASYAASATAAQPPATAAQPRSETPAVRDAAVSKPSEPSTVAQLPATSAPQTPSFVPDRPLRHGPVSVFISRKEHRLYVRKGFAPVFDMPVTIHDQDRSIGTHVFTAMALNSDGETFRWNVVSIAPGALHPERRAEMEMRLARRSQDKEIVSDAVPPPPSPVAAAKDALDRLEIPQEAVTRISELMSAGASLIVTDEGLGPETGQETDFVVLTHDNAVAADAGRKR